MCERSQHRVKRDISLTNAMGSKMGSDFIIKTDVKTSSLKATQYVLAIWAAAHMYLSYL